MAIADQTNFFVNRVRKRLWVRPLAAFILSIAAMMIAKAVDHVGSEWSLPRVTPDSIQKGLAALATVGDPAMRDAARAHSRMALTGADKKLGLPEHVALVREAAAFSLTPPQTVD